MTLHYYRTTTQISTDQIALIATLARTANDSGEQPYIAYEGPHGVWFGEGVLAEITVDPIYVHYRQGDQHERIAWDTDPLAIVKELAGRIDVDDWHGYGTAEFELALAIAGVVGPRTGRPLLRMIVPQREVRIEPTGLTELRATTLDDLRTLQDRVHTHTAPSELGGRVKALDFDELAAKTHEDGYRDRVRSALDAIASGALDKMILSRQLELDFSVDLIDSYEHGRRHNTPARSFLLSFESVTAAGFSPEIVAQTDQTGVVRTQPLAGTRARVQDATTNRELNHALYTNPKEIYEHAISVKLACEELDIICQPGTVHVSEFMRTKERGTVQHLGSQVEGQMAGHADPWRALSALFPSVTASGIPKRPAFEHIARIEGRPRGLYSGAVFTVDHAGRLDAALVLRTLFQVDGCCWMQAGAGIVSDSTPERESTETLEKMQSVSNHLVRAADRRETSAGSELPAAG